MGIPSLPTELRDEIIAWIPSVCGEREKNRTLLSCCLVCSEWLPTSRDQLFRELWIRNPERYDLLLSRVNSSETSRGYLLHVRSVVLYINWNPPIFKRRPFVLEFPGHLPNVTTLTIAFRSIDTFMSHPSSFVVISRFLSLKELKLRFCKFPSFAALRRTLTFLPSLTDLELHRPSWPVPAADLSPHLSHGASTVSRSALLLLEICSWDTGPDEALSGHRRRASQFMTWLSQTATSTSLVKLVFRVNDIGEPEYGGRSMTTFRPFLSRFGGSVRELDFEVRNSDSTGQYKSTHASQNAD